MLTNLTIQGGSGVRASTGLPEATTMAEFAPSQLPTGTVTVNVQTNAAYTGAFTVAPVDMSHTTFYNAFACPLSNASVAVPSNKFTALKKVTYNKANGTWRTFVTVPARAS